MIQIHLTTTKTENQRNIFAWTSMGPQQDSSWRKMIGKEFLSTRSQAVADCWVGTGPESFSAKSKKATHGAVCASKIITWDQKTPAKSTQQCSSEEARNASVQNVTSKCDLSSKKREENTSTWRMWAMYATVVSLDGETSRQITTKEINAFVARTLLEWNHGRSSC